MALGCWCQYYRLMDKTPSSLATGSTSRTVTVNTDAAIVEPTEPEPAQASASFVSRNTVVIAYNAPLDASSDYAGDVYGPVTVDGNAMPITRVSGLGTSTHTVVFDGSVTGSQSGTIMVNTELSGMVNDVPYRFGPGMIDVAAGGDGTIMPNANDPIVPIVSDGFVRTVDVTDRGDSARPAINITALSPDPLGADTADNTAKFPAQSTMIRSSFAHVTFPPNTNASSVPADGLLDLYISSSGERPTAAAVAPRPWQSGRLGGDYRQGR